MKIAASSNRNILLHTTAIQTRSRSNPSFFWGDYVDVDIIERLIGVEKKVHKIKIEIVCFT